MAAPAAAQVLISKELTEFEQVSTDAVDAFFRPAAPLGEFNVDFSTFDSPVTATFTWSAPAGELFEVVIPGDAAFARIGFSFDIGGTSTDDEIVVPLVSSFEDFSGPAISPLGSLSQVEMANASNLQIAGGFGFQLTPGQTYHFSSVTAEGVIPADYNVAHNTTIDEFRMSVLAAYLGLPPSDVPPLVSLVPVPEPTSLAMLGLSGLIVTRRRRD